MKKIVSTILIILTINLLSCAAKHSKIALVRLESAFILHSSPTFKGYFYQGTDSNFHYFVSRWQYAKDKPFKLRKTEVNVARIFSLKYHEQAVDLLKTQKSLSKKTPENLYIILE